MGGTVSTGRQDFALMREENNFYVDKTKFIEEWWNDDKDVTLITRPRRFVKTLMMSTVKCFFSLQYKGRKDLFDGLYISQNQDMMRLQGMVPVIALSFAEAKKLKESMLDVTEYQTMVLRLKIRYRRFSTVSATPLAVRNSAMTKNVTVTLSSATIHNSSATFFSPSRSSCCARCWSSSMVPNRSLC